MERDGATDMIDEQTRRDMLDNDIARATHIAKRTLGKDAEAYLHPYMGIVVRRSADNFALSKDEMQMPDDLLGRLIADAFEHLQARRDGKK
jgi:hypothetical protein